MKQLEVLTLAVHSYAHSAVREVSREGTIQCRTRNGSPGGQGAARSGGEQRCDDRRRRP